MRQESFTYYGKRSECKGYGAEEVVGSAMGTACIPPPDSNSLTQTMAYRYWKHSKSPIEVELNVALDSSVLWGQVLCPKGRLSVETKANVTQTNTAEGGAESTRSALQG